MSADPKPSQSTLLQIFNEAAAQYCAAYPVALKDVMMLFIENMESFSLKDAPPQVIYFKPDCLEIYQQWPPMLDRLVENLVELLQTSSGAAAPALSGFMPTPPLLGLNLARMADESLCTMLWVLDHEVGHQVVEGSLNEMKDTHLSECAADAFATLRCIQRHSDAEALQEIHSIMVRSASGNLVYGGSPIHYTIPVMQKIQHMHQQWLEKGQGVDIRALSPDETATLAGTIAHEHRLPPKLLQKLVSTISFPGDYHEDYKNTPGKVLQIMRQTQDHHIYRAGKLYLEDVPAKDLTEQDRRMLEELKSLEGTSGFHLNAFDAPAAPAKKPIWKRIFGK